jgi:hypothetical protein
LGGTASVKVVVPSGKLGVEAVAAQSPLASSVSRLIDVSINDSRQESKSGEEKLIGHSDWGLAHGSRLMV